MVESIDWRFQVRGSVSQRGRAMPNFSGGGYQSKKQSKLAYFVFRGKERPPLASSQLDAEGCAEIGSDT